LSKREEIKHEGTTLKEQRASGYKGLEEKTQNEKRKDKNILSKGWWLEQEKKD